MTGRTWISSWSVAARRVSPPRSRPARPASHAVTVVEREAEAGGIPRHTAHTGYGLRELHRLLDGPAYARAWRARAEHAGVELLTAYDGHRLGRPARAVTTTSPAGMRTVDAARGRPRDRLP